MQGPRRPTRQATTGERRSLSHVGGAIAESGDPAAAERLAAALDVPTSAESEEAARAHVHGFHTYPARMHPLTARRLVEAFSRPRESVLDPFCGSGTVLVEARLAGRRAVGVDANPLAVRLSRLKVRGVREAERARLVDAARRVAEVADERRRARTGASRRYGRDDVALFDAHVLLELDGLRVGLDQLPDAGIRADLELVLSSILTKLSRRASDTSDKAAPRRIAAGFAAKLFVRKTEELARRLAEVSDALGAAPPPLVLEGDARELAGVEDGSVALAVTSPPYPGVYDYLAHHAARLRWLRLRPDRFEAREVGARRNLEPLGAAEGRRKWQDELRDVLRAVRRTLRPDGLAVLLIADSAVGNAPVYADDLVRATAPSADLSTIAVASQERPHFHRPTARVFASRPRREHAILVGASAPRKDPSGSRR